jgi:hypothetical protein
MFVIDDTNKENKDEAKEEKILSLDETHDQVLQDLEKEGGEDAKDLPEAGADNADVSSNEDEKEDEVRNDPADDDKGDGTGGEPEPKIENKPIEEPPQLPEPTTDVGVEVKDYEGTVHKFKNFDDIPDDFEPQNYKEFARFTVAMNTKLANDQKREQDRLREEADRDRESRIKQIKDSWEKDIQSLTKSKELPVEEKEREKVVAGVYEVINEHLADSKVIDFAPAFEIYQYRQMKAQSQERKNKEIDEKKDRASLIQGQGTPTPSSRSNVREAPPSGVSLDAVHESVLENL